MQIFTLVLPVSIPDYLARVHHPSFLRVVQPDHVDSIVDCFWNIAISEPSLSTRILRDITSVLMAQRDSLEAQHPAGEAVVRKLDAFLAKLVAATVSRDPALCCEPSCKNRAVKRSKSNRCAACKSTYYCSVECQRK